jgi:hypothetical protein
MTHDKEEFSQGKLVVIGLVKIYSGSWRRVTVETFHFSSTG